MLINSPLHTHCHILWRYELTRSPQEFNTNDTSLITKHSFTCLAGWVGRQSGLWELRQVTLGRVPDTSWTIVTDSRSRWRAESLACVSLTLAAVVLSVCVGRRRRVCGMETSLAVGWSRSRWRDGGPSSGNAAQGSTCSSSHSDNAASSEPCSLETSHPQIPFPHETD